MDSKKITFYHAKDNIEIIYSNQSNIKYPLHTHSNNYIIGLILSGCIQIQQENQTQICKKEEIFIIPPNVAHSIYNDSDRYSTLMICIPIELIYKEDVEKLQEKVRTISLYLIQEGNIDERVTEMINDAISVLFISVLGINKLIDTEIKFAKDFLQENTDRTVCINQLAEKVFISPYYLIRKFKKQIGITPHQFQIQARIRKAQQMLRYQDDITQVALEAGFCDQSHLDKCFRKLVGITPREYQKAQYRINAEKK